MLPFGSITSIIPLFVLGFAYLLFLGTSALSKGDTNRDKAFDDSRVVSYQPRNEVQHDDSCYWDSLSQAAEINEISGSVASPPPLIARVRIWDESPGKVYFRISFSIRPPPALA